MRKSNLSRNQECNDAKMWYNSQNSQKLFMNQLQKLQNSTLRKTLRSFRIASSETTKIELNILSIEIRMHLKMQKYALCTLKMTENHSIRIRTSIFYFFEYQNKIFDKDFIQWDEKKKKTCISDKSNFKHHDFTCELNK